MKVLPTEILTNAKAIGIDQASSASYQNQRKRMLNMTTIKHFFQTSVAYYYK